MRDLFFPYKRVTSKVFGEVKILAINIRDGKEIGIDAILDTGAVISVFQ